MVIGIESREDRAERRRQIELIGEGLVMHQRLRGSSIDLEKEQAGQHGSARNTKGGFVCGMQPAS
jgi:hypothetical protein